GVRLHEAGWFGPAVGRFRQAIAIDPASARAHLWLGRALYRAGRHAEAVQALEKVIELSQTGPHAEEARALLSRFR
ncbi:MAG: tetratricopeptide repeat protein, partial [Armatimonadetes bacterium]|nr:tetratricopeptide repeat protein [Armatimonadota bacterium]